MNPHDTVKSMLAFRAARARLEIHPVRESTTALQYLNQIAKQSTPYRSYIYAMKNNHIAWLWKNGYCVEARKTEQRVPCKYCDGTTFYDGGSCEHCCGTGVYRTNTLWNMVFNIEGWVYRWHTPQNKLIVHINETFGDVPPVSYSYPEKAGVLTMLEMVAQFQQERGFSVDAPWRLNQQFARLVSQWT